MDSDNIIKDFLKISSMKRHERELFDKYPHIENGKLITDCMNSKLEPKFKVNGLNYNFSLKYMNLIEGLSITNELIIESFEAWEYFNKNYYKGDYYNGYYLTKMYKLNEYIISDMKRFIDESIATIWCLKHDKILNNIEIDSIGKFLGDLNNKKNRGKKPKLPELIEFKDFFSIINDICNANKHSFTNDFKNRCGEEENCVIAMYAKGNKDINNTRLYIVRLKDIIKDFNKFYKKFFEIVENM